MRTLARLALAAGLAATPAAVNAQAPAELADVGVKAAFLYNFVKFAEWPKLAGRVTIIACVVGDGPLADALVGIVRGQHVSGHGLAVVRPGDEASWVDCQLLFIGGSQVAQAAAGLARVKTLPVLTVSDGADFAKSSGIVELYIDGGRMRFAINVDAVERSGLRLSSRLLGLATVVKDPDVQ